MKIYLLFSAHTFVKGNIFMFVTNIFTFVKDYFCEGNSFICVKEIFLLLWRKYFYFCEGKCETGKSKVYRLWNPILSRLPISVKEILEWKHHTSNRVGKQIFLLLWKKYFYFCKGNIGMETPNLQQSWGKYFYYTRYFF